LCANEYTNFVEPAPLRPFPDALLVAEALPEDPLLLVRLAEVVVFF
jgi:hypothetical protein